MTRRCLIAAAIAIALAALGATALYRFALTPRGFRTVQAGVLYRCRQPVGWQWNVLKRHGIRTVIDLRPAAEDPAAFANEQEACRQAGAKFVNIPIDRMPPTDEQIEHFLAAVREGPAPALVHCEHGKTRAGFMTAVYRVAAQDWPVDQAVDEMLRYGDTETASLAPAARDILRQWQGRRPGKSQEKSQPESAP